MWILAVLILLIAFFGQKFCGLLPFRDKSSQFISAIRVPLLRQINVDAGTDGFRYWSRSVNVTSTGFYLAHTFALTGVAIVICIACSTTSCHQCSRARHWSFDAVKAYTSGHSLSLHASLEFTVMCFCVFYLTA